MSKDKINLELSHEEGMRLLYLLPTDHPVTNTLRSKILNEFGRLVQDKQVSKPHYDNLRRWGMLVELEYEWKEISKKPIKHRGE